MRLEDLKVYSLACQLSRESWLIYNTFPWQIKKVIGDQFITAADSVGANIAEGWGRFHFRDKNKFNYNARASLLETGYWLGLLVERDLVTAERGNLLIYKIQILHIKLNNYIKATNLQIKKKP